MPYIELNTTCVVSPAQEKQIKEALGEAISLLPGMCERYLMLQMRDQCRMYFGGDKAEPCAFVAVNRFGTIPADASAALTGRITEIVEAVLGVSPQRTFIQYTEAPYWGCRGRSL